MPDGQPVPRDRKRNLGLLRTLGRLLLDSGTQALVLHRAAHLLYRLGIPVLPAALRRINIMLSGADIHPGAQLGRHVALLHSVGVIIGDGTVVEECCEIYGGVTLGGYGGGRPDDGCPRICADSVICSGALVLGPITIGRSATVAAGAVVLESIPDNALAAGSPATVKKIYRNTGEGA